MRLIVTRPQEDADALKTRLEALGHKVILSPLLEILPLADAVIRDAPYQLIALTSANGMRALARHPALPQLRSRPVLAVGPQSAQAARSAGFSDVTMAGGDAIGLAEYIAKTGDRRKGPVLYLSGRDSAGNFAARLEARGFTVARVIAYEARAASQLSAEVHSGADGVLLFSPRTARIWVELIARSGLEAAARGMIHICISKNAGAALPETYPRRIAAQATEAAMLDVIASLGNRPLTSPQQ